MIRRRFIASTFAAFSSFLCWPVRGVFASEGLERREDSRIQLMRLFSDMKAARTIGRQYLVRYPQEGNFETLYDLLSKGQKIDLGSPPWTVLKRHDFENENIVTIQGWYFAKCEARAMALASVLHR